MDIKAFFDIMDTNCAIILRFLSGETRQDRSDTFLRADVESRVLQLLRRTTRPFPSRGKEGTGKIVFVGRLSAVKISEFLQMASKPASESLKEGRKRSFFGHVILRNPTGYQTEKQPEVP